MVFKKSLAVVLAVSAVVCSVFSAPMTTEAKKVKKTVRQESRLSLTYDDRYTFDSPIKSIEQVRIDSEMAGTKVPDVAVLVSEDKKKVAATGCGVARVTLKNGEVYRVAVKSAPISLILLIGQSNMEGFCSVAKELSLYKSQQILSPEGTVYSTYAPAYKYCGKYIGYYNSEITLNDKNAESFIPANLTANGSRHKYCHTNNLTKGSNTGGKNGMDGSFGYTWNRITKEKVWLINAANSGSSIEKWKPGIEGSFYDRAMKLYDRAMDVMDEEIEAGHFKLSRKGYLWMQGEMDSDMRAADYYTNFCSLHTSLKSDMYGKKHSHAKKKISFAGLCMVRNVDDTTYINTRDIEDNLKPNGPREAYKLLADSGDPILKNVIMATDVEEKWSSDQKVAEYFLEEYGSVKKYNKYNPMVKEADALPDSVDDVHDNIHFKQLGYNEIGRTAAMEICDYLGY
ncbi:MAG: sialate O-acetylesterase [Lachnospiraceae bacterium]|nr:sialate O-acetylesterase [Lachnospiraceae bacterium]